MSILITDYITDKTKEQEYIDRINSALGFYMDEKESSWVKFLERHDIVIAPATENVGVVFDEFRGKSVSTIASDTRTYNDVPGTFFGIGTILNKKTITKHIVFLNVTATKTSYTSMNFFAHELGHAIDYALGLDHYYSNDAEFTVLFAKYGNFFDSMQLKQNIKDYLKLKNEYFAECFAFYRSKDKKLKDMECYDEFFGTTIVGKPKEDMTPHAYLKTEAGDIDKLFKAISKK